MQLVFKCPVLTRDWHTDVRKSGSFRRMLLKSSQSLAADVAASSSTANSSATTSANAAPLLTDQLTQRAIVRWTRAPDCAAPRRCILCARARAPSFNALAKHHPPPQETNEILLKIVEAVEKSSAAGDLTADCCWFCVALCWLVFVVTKQSRFCLSTASVPQAAQQALLDDMHVELRSCREQAARASDAAAAAEGFCFFFVVFLFCPPKRNINLLLLLLLLLLLCRTSRECCEDVG
jgi:hypothetical protein